MKRTLLSGFLFLYTLYAAIAQITALPVTLNLQEQSLSFAFQEIEQQTAVRFFYEEEWLPTPPITASFQAESLASVLGSLLKDRQLSFRFYRDYAVIVAPDDLLKQEYSRDFYIRQEQEQMRALTQKEEEVLAPLVVGDASRPSTGTVKIQGFINDDNNQEPLIGATILVEETGSGTSSDATGQYELNLPVGTYQIKIQSIGYQESLRTLKVYSDGSLDLLLAKEAIQLAEVVVEADGAEQSIRSTQMGVENISVKQLKKLPAFLGEVDVVKSLLLLPGVSTVGEGSGGFNVRGGTVDQNLIMQDGAFVFNSSHVLGFFSVFNSDVVKKVTLYKGSIPAKYGGRLSSVLDVELKEGNFKEWTGKGGVGLVASRLVLEGPLAKGKTSMIIGLRSSYSDWILRQVRRVSVRNSSAFFYDANLKFTHLLGKGSSISASAYINQDNFRFSDEFSFGWKTNMANIDWKQIISDRFSMNLQGIFSNYASTLTIPEGNTAFDLDASSTYFKIKPDFTFVPNDQHTMSFGLEAIQYQIEPGKITPGNSTSIVSPREVEAEQGREIAFYLGDDYKISSIFSLTAGLRYTLYQNLGAKKVYTYAEGEQRIPENVVDSTTYGNGEVIKTYSSLEPRVALNITLDKQTSIKMGYNRTVQYINQISNTASVSPVDVWQLSNTYVRPQIADNYSIGFFRNFSGTDWQTSLEFYYRDITQLVDFKDFAQLLANPSIETELLEGEGRNYGLELSIKRKVGRWNGWLGYTYSKTERKVEATPTTEAVNQGRWYPSNFDKPHDLTIVAACQVNRRNTISINFTYNTGRPVSAPIGKYTVENGINIPNYSERNQFRIPDYHRLDVSWTLETNHRKNKNLESSWTFSIYNVYGRRNSYSVFFRQAPFQNPQAFSLSVLGSVFPALTYNFKF